MWDNLPLLPDCKIKVDSMCAAINVQFSWFDWRLEHSGHGELIRIASVDVTSSFSVQNQVQS